MATPSTTRGSGLATSVEPLRGGFEAPPDGHVTDDRQQDAHVSNAVESVHELFAITVLQFFLLDVDDFSDDFCVAYPG